MTTAALNRRLGPVDAVTIGLGSMIGAGLFSAFAPAAAAAGAGLLVGLLLAAFVAFCNATSSAQLAAQYPTSGGSYVYGRERLGHWPGFLAGWSFVIGKTASGAAMAITVAAYLAPTGWQRPVAVAAIVLLAAVNYLGITRTAGLARAIVAVVVVVLVLVVAVSFGSGAARPDAAVGDLFAGGGYGILQSAGLLFFAFAGYARIATLGEEVRDPQRTIPRAILIALAITLVVYAAVAVTVLFVLGIDRLAASAAPLIDTVTVAGSGWLVPVVRVAAGIAALGALLALIAGVSRTALAMARNSDLPRWLSAVHPRFLVPHHAELLLAVVMIVLVLTFDLRGAIGFSSFGVLLYYVVANLSALSQDRPQRRYPRVMQVCGAVGCLVLVAALPVPSIVGGAVVLAVGAAYRVLRLRLRLRLRP